MKTMRKYRHSFRFKVSTVDGETKIFKAPAAVRKAKAPVSLILTADDVRQSMKLKGVGNTQTCSMACCTKRLAKSFPHPVEGFIDWQYSRAYVVSRIDKETGLPAECVIYYHSDNIAQLNDSRGGQKTLLADLEANGPREINLLPVPKWRPREPNRPRGRDDGSRLGKVRAIPARGAKLRYAVALLGGVPQ